MKELIKTDRNGTKWFNEHIRCDRCGGDGIYKWGAMISYGGGAPVPQYSGVCFKCNGAGKVLAVTKEYTPEYRAKLDAANDKRKAKQREKWEAERAERVAAYAEQMRKEAEERARKEKERLAEIERNRGHFVGEVGGKIEVEVTLDRTFSYEVPCYNAPWKKDMVTGYVFKTDEGNTLVWKTTGALHAKEYKDGGHFLDNEKDGWYDYIRPEIGDRLSIKGTIKAHEEFNNVNQTILNRVKWVR